MKTQFKYEEMLRQFKEFCMIHQLERSTPQQLDFALEEWMSSQYLDGEDPWKGGYMIAALQWADPNLSKQGHKVLVNSYQAVKGWRRLVPPKSRLRSRKS
eukprot:9499748-Karenia_brevis.AAC.1